MSSGVSETKIGLKLVKKTYIHIFNSTIIKSGNIYTLKFYKMTYLENMISGKNVVTELTTRKSEAKTKPKFVKNLLDFFEFLSNYSIKIT